MRTSGQGLRFIKEFETGGTFRHIGYVEADYKGNPTVGFGHRVFPGQRSRFVGRRISRSEAEGIFASDIRRAEAAVGRVVKMPLTQYEFDALVSLAFNAGSGVLTATNLAQYINTGQWELAQAAFYERALDRGLFVRRAAEVSMFADAEYLSLGQAIGRTYWID